jgi:hypothetical protein
MENKSFWQVSISVVFNLGHIANEFDRNLLPIGQMVEKA